MKVNKVAVVAIGLWGLTIAIGSWFFIRGSATEGLDGRMTVVLAPAEREQVLGEMRALLAAVHDILSGIERNDRQEIAKSARSVGMAAAADVNPALLGRLPLPFKATGMSVHRSMDALASDAENGKPVAELLHSLNDTLGLCVGCHATWRIKSGSGS